MALTFRSSQPETKVVIEREPDGRQRVARATKNDGSTRHWDLRVEHPNGQSWGATFNGDGAAVVVALGQMLAGTENQWKQSRAAGDRPPPSRMAFDYNRRLSDDGAASISPIPTNRR